MKKSAPRREMFPKEFLVDLNATKAAIRCGYLKRCARNAGARLMANANIKKTIRELMAERAERLKITGDEWLTELIIAGKFDPANIYGLAEGGELSLKSFEEMGPWRRAISEIREDRLIKEVQGKDDMVLSDKRTVKFVSKLDALKLIGQHLGFLKDPRLEISGNVNINARLSLADFKKSIKRLADEK